jgi:hypothetical protein
LASKSVLATAKLDPNNNIQLRVKRIMTTAGKRLIQG